MKSKPLLFCLTGLVLALSPLPARAQDSASTDAPAAVESAAAEEEAAHAAFDKFLAGLKYKTGSQTVSSAGVILDLPDGFRFLEQADARSVLVDLWGNPEQAAEDVCGMILPPGETVEGEEAWAVVLSFEKSGYVSDDDADEIDYDDLLKSMKAGTRESNKQRKALGVPEVTLVGWALPPKYEKDTHVLHWAKELSFDDSDTHTLNYDVRVLGRRGVASLNCVAPMSRLSAVKEHASDLVSMTSFVSGEAYSDFNSSTDHKAELGLAGLIVGGAVAAKTGLLKGIFAALLAAKKLVIVGILAIGAAIKKIFGNKG